MTNFDTAAWLPWLAVLVPIAFAYIFGQPVEGEFAEEYEEEQEERPARRKRRKLRVSR